MTKEQIEQAANVKYSDNTFAYKGFINGANWRVNSVWHDMYDVPEQGKDCLVEYIDGYNIPGIRIDKRTSYEWVNACHYDKIKRWAYIKDLLPSAPSFDEILNDNKDVLKRLKEKGENKE